MLKRAKNNKIIAQCITLLIPENEINLKYNYRGKIMYTSSLANVLYNPKRTNRIVEIIVEHALKGRKILVLGEYIKHLKDIMKGVIKREEEESRKIADKKGRKEAKPVLDKFMPLLPSELKNIVLNYVKRDIETPAFTYGLYIGEMKNEARKESETKDVILGTYKLASVGMDIPHLNTLIMASPRKEIEQSVGRILRKEDDAAAVKPLIIDIIDNHGIFANQSRVRKRFYKEYGYTIEYLRMKPVTGEITSKRVVRTSAPKVDLSIKGKKGKKGKTKQTKLKTFLGTEIPDVCLLSDSED